MKTCPKCKTEKSESNFCKSKSQKDGFQSWCKACHNIARLTRYKNNREEELIKKQERHEHNRKDERIKDRARRKANLDKDAAKVAKRRAGKFQATPAWADQEGIKDFYFSAKTLTDLFHKPYHVDHIVPLKAKRVCGLHVPANLQVLIGADNISKGNRHWPDMP